MVSNMFHQLQDQTCKGSWEEKESAWRAPSAGWGRAAGNTKQITMLSTYYLLFNQPKHQVYHCPLPHLSSWHTAFNLDHPEQCSAFLCVCQHQAYTCKGSWEKTARPWGAPEDRGRAAWYTKQNNMPRLLPNSTNPFGSEVWEAQTLSLSSSLPSSAHQLFEWHKPGSTGSCKEKAGWNWGSAQRP